MCSAPRLVTFAALLLVTPSKGSSAADLHPCVQAKDTIDCSNVTYSDIKRAFARYSQRPRDPLITHFKADPLLFEGKKGHLEAGLFSGVDFKHITITRSGLQSFDADFVNQSLLHFVDFSHNRIEKQSVFTFLGNHRMSASLAFNRLTAIPREARLEAEYYNFSSNRITEIGSYAFTGPSKVIDLANNEVNRISSFAFSLLQAKRRKTSPKTSSSSLIGLQTNREKGSTQTTPGGQSVAVYLDNNKLNDHSFAAFSFSNLTHITVYLRNNSITLVNQTFLATLLRQNNSLYLTGNPIDCRLISKYEACEHLVNAFFECINSFTLYTTCTNSKRGKDGDGFLGTSAWPNVGAKVQIPGANGEHEKGQKSAPGWPFYAITAGVVVIVTLTLGGVAFCLIQKWQEKRNSGSNYEGKWFSLKQQQPNFRESRFLSSDH